MRDPASDGRMRRHTAHLARAAPILAQYLAALLIRGELSRSNSPVSPVAGEQQKSVGITFRGKPSHSRKK